jgi:hypothetical protein
MERKVKKKTCSAIPTELIVLLRSHSLAVFMEKILFIVKLLLIKNVRAVIVIIIIKM